MHIIDARGITKTYTENGVPVEALRGIDLVVEEGEFTVIAGPSGSGKTTLLNILGAIDQPTSGSVVLDGAVLADMTRARISDMRLRKLGFIFQAYNLIPVLSARENIEFPLMLRGVGDAERRRRALALMEELGIASLADTRPNAMSGGQQQRVAVARAIVGDPRLVLADEPTANLDTATGAMLLDLMEQLNRDKGITFLFSSHDPQVIARAHRLLLLRDGRFEAATTPRDRP